MVLNKLNILLLLLLSILRHFYNETKEKEGHTTDF